MSDSLYATIAQGVNPLTQAGSAVQVMRGMQDLRTQQFNLQQAKLQPAYAGLNALLEDPNPTWDKVSRSLANSERLGGDTSALSDAANDMMANGGQPGDFIRQYGTARYVPPFEAAGLFLPKPTAAETGAGTLFGTIGAPGGAHPGAFTPSDFVPRQATPEWLGQQDTWTDPVTFQTKTGTRAQHLQALGIDPNSLLQGAPPVTGAGGGAAGVSGGGLTGDAKEAALNNIAMRESGNRNVMNREGSGAGGIYQIMPKTWAEGLALAGLSASQYPTAIGAPTEVQHQVASALFDKYGESPWTASAGNAAKFPGYDAIQAARGAKFPGSYQVAGPATTPPPSTGATAPAAAGAGPAPAPGTPITLPSPYTAAQYDTSAKLYGNDMLLERTLTQRTQPWLNALNVLAANPDLKTGPTQQQVTQWETAFSAAGIPFPAALRNLTGDPAAYQELAKYLAQGLRGQGLGSSDVDRLQNEATMPNPDMKRDAIQELVAKQIGAERLKTAGLRYFNNLPEFGGDPGNALNSSHLYLGKTTSWLSNLDPTALGADVMSPEASKDYYQHLPSQALKDRYKQSLVSAQKLFGVTMPLPPAPGG